MSRVYRICYSSSRSRYQNHGRCSKRKTYCFLSSYREIKCHLSIPMVSAGLNIFFCNRIGEVYSLKYNIPYKISVLPLDILRYGISVLFFEDPIRLSKVRAKIDKKRVAYHKGACSIGKMKGTVPKPVSVNLPLSFRRSSRPITWAYLPFSNCRCAIFPCAELRFWDPCPLEHWCLR